LIHAGVFKEIHDYLLTGKPGDIYWYIEEAVFIG
jgi:hypothetical protein